MAKSAAYKSVRDRSSESVEPLLLNRDQVAMRLGVSVRGVDAWIRQGLIRTVPLGRLKKVPLSEVERICREGIQAEPEAVVA